jgi:two-component system, chemotaxis family, CheB/CheR fusion protein
VCHELRNPVSAILGWADVLSGESIDSVEFAHAIEVIKHSALLGTKLIDQLLDFSRISTGVFQLNLQNIAIVPVLESAIEMTRLQARIKSIELDADLMESPTPIVGDSSRLQQVFTNLLSNAIKFTPRGGRVQVGVKCPQNFIEIRVSDTGCGISTEFLPFVFDRFRQQVAETTEKGGLGLGLAIARFLVEEHGGMILANSEGSGKGATFTVCLPLGPLYLHPEVENRF